VGDSTFHLVLDEGVDVVAMRFAAGSRELGNRRVQPLAVGIDGRDASALTADDVGRRAPNAARGCSDERNPAFEPHRLSSPVSLVCDASLCVGAGPAGASLPGHGLARPTHACPRGLLHTRLYERSHDGTVLRRGRSAADAVQGRGKLYLARSGTLKSCML